MLCGCASRRTVDYARLMEQYDIGGDRPRVARQDPAATDTADVPDAPAPGLPPLGAAGAGPFQAAKEELRIQPDCLVQIRVQEEPSLNGTYSVNRIGAVQFGYIGPVILLNTTEREAARKIEDLLMHRNFLKATVAVEIQRASYDKIRVMGDVVKPGEIKIGAGGVISLNDALLQAEGLRASAQWARVKIVRDGMLSAVAASLPGEEFSLVDTDGMPSVPEVYLSNNDVVFVASAAGPGAREEAGKRILVLGEVKREGIYEFGPGEPCSMMYLIFKMGGLPPYANHRAIKIIRRDDYGNEQEIKVNARRVLEEGNPDYDIPLRDGDRVVVPARIISLF